MSTTVANQKWLRIHKTSLRNSFLQVAHADWMGVNKNPELGPFALQLYLFLAGNANGYEFGLSAAYAEQSAGIKRTSFHKYLRLLEKHGYIVWRCGNVYDFYTTPRPENERTDPDNHESFISFDESPDGQDDDLQPSENLFYDDDVAIRTTDFLTEFASQTASTAQQTSNPHCEQENPQDNEICSPCDKEIDNVYCTDNEDKEITDSGTLCVPAGAADAAPATIGKEVIVRIDAKEMQRIHEQKVRENKALYRF